MVASTTLAAYATAFAAELDLVERMVVRLQDTFAAQSCAGPGEAADVSLAALEYASQVAFFPTNLCAHTSASPVMFCDTHHISEFTRVH